MEGAGSRNGTRVVKSLFVVFFTALSLSIYVVRRTGELFPWLPPFVLLCVACLVGVSWVDSISKRAKYFAVLSGAVFLGVSYRLVVFYFPPSLVGMDPDQFAAWSHLTRLTGNVSTWDPFYSHVPFFHLFTAIVSMVLDVGAPASLGVFSLVTGSLSVLVASGLALYFSQSVSAANVAAILASVLAADLLVSYWPVPQTLGDTLFYLFLYLLLTVFWRNSWRVHLTMVVLLVGMLFTHKIPLLVGFATTFTVAAISVLFSNEGLGRVADVLRLDRRTSPPMLGSVVPVLTAWAGFFLLALTVQWVVLVDYYRSAIRLVRSVLSFDTMSSLLLELFSNSAESFHPSGGLVPEYGVWIVFQLASFQAILAIAIGGVLGLYLLYVKGAEFHTFVLLTISAVLVSFIGASSLSGWAVSPFRMYWLASLVVVVLISVGLDGIGMRSRSGKTFVSVALAVLLVTQLFSAAALPNYPDRPRYYLQEDEIAAKEFGYEFVPGRIWTDGYFADEIIDFERIDRKHHPAVDLDPEGKKYVGIDQQLFQCNVTGQGYDYVAYRSDPDVYRVFDTNFSYSIYELTWDPEARLDPTYGRIYANGNVVLYHPARRQNASRSEPSADCPFSE